MPGSRHWATFINLSASAGGGSSDGCLVHAASNGSPGAICRLPMCVRVPYCCDTVWAPYSVWLWTWSIWEIPFNSAGCHHTKLAPVSHYNRTASPEQSRHGGSGRDSSRAQEEAKVIVIDRRRYHLMYSVCGYYFSYLPTTNFLLSQAAASYTGAPRERSQQQQTMATSGQRDHFSLHSAQTVQPDLVCECVSVAVISLHTAQD